MNTESTQGIMNVTDNSIELASKMKAAGQVANRVVSSKVFSLYLAEKSENTKRTHLNALNAFSKFLATAGVNVAGDSLQSSPTAWAGVTFGLVESFKQWQLNEGASIATINNRLSAIKVYVKLATQSDVVNADESMKIKNVTGYSRKVGKRIDETRTAENVPTRSSTKKSESVTINAEQAGQMIDHDLDTPQGSRDALLMSLLLEHGLRCSEIAILKVTDFKKIRGKWHMTFERPKVDKSGTHKLTAATSQALDAYLEFAPALGGMIRSSRKGGHLTETTMSERAITKRAKSIARSIDIDGFSAHDCRHYAATDMARKGYTILELMDWFGWSSPAMAVRYVESAKVQTRDKG